MDIGLVLGLLKVALETFNAERRDRFLKQYTKLEKEWQDEMALPDDQRSDLALDRILFECKQLAKLVITEAGHK